MTATSNAHSEAVTHILGTTSLSLKGIIEDVGVLL